MIFQDPLSSLHPFYKVGAQLSRRSRPTARSPRRRPGPCRRVAGLVKIPDPQRRVDQYPHEFSGGMRQRVMIAMALSNDPKVLIADEPTTALDVTVQAQIMSLLAELQERLGMAIILITHDLGVVAEIADVIAVMYAGRIVEHAPAEQIFAAPQHPYTWGLLKSIPRLDTPRDEELVPISGRPPSLIKRPSGCFFHPRCPYARESHTRIDPKREPVPGDPGPRGRLPARARRARANLEAARRRRVARCPQARVGGRAAAPVVPDHRSLPPGPRESSRERHRKPAGRGPRPRQALPDQAGSDVPAPDRRGEGGRRSLVRRAGRRDAGDRGRDRLRQEHDREAAGAPARSHVRVDHVRGR